MSICVLLFYSFVLLVTNIFTAYIAYDTGIIKGRIIQIDKELKRW